MYGTVARMTIKPGHEQALIDVVREHLDARSEGRPTSLAVYKLDAAENEYIMAVGFESKEAYEANASSPDQHARYLQYMEHLASEPAWEDGEIIFTSS